LGIPHGSFYSTCDKLDSLIGYALFKVATQSLHKAGYQVAHLWVLDSNERAIQSYKKWGGITDTALVKEADIGGRPIKEIAVSFQLVPT